ncbi:unnamed protein product [Paramecium pentaurelia]|uniref:Uncharacterized protein n=1 Tax=Paramecium pentaurelia TaxID=43138 RepID=A0A8S1X878_9CILI|nr:unnamed protein product [Paramecium pentaurelia]
MNQLLYKTYEVYSGNLLIDYWSYKEDDQGYLKIQMKKINKKMIKLKIRESKRKKKEENEIIDKIIALCI